MRRFSVGDLVMIDPGYHSGIWLRSDLNVGMSDSSVWVPPDGLVVVLEMIDENVRIVGGGGRVGWTWMSRLVELE